MQNFLLLSIETMKYLGVSLDQKLSFAYHIQEMTKNETCNKFF